MNYYTAMSQKQAIFGLMGGAVQMYRGIYNPTADAVWLAAGTNDARTALDVGVGTGGVALCLMAHYPDMTVTGLDASGDMLAAAAQNAELNNRQIELIQGDIYTWKTDRTFDLVISNPPYFKGTPAHHNAHHNADLGSWTRRCAARVRPGGTLCMIMDAGAMDEIIAAMRAASFGGITIFPLMGRGATAERVIIRARHGSRTPCQLHPGFDMADKRILRDGLTIASLLTTLGPDA